MTKALGRNALTKNVRAQAAEIGVPDQRLRTWVAASALLQTLLLAKHGGALPDFYVKGGFALELRFKDRSRTSQDIDLVLLESPAQIHGLFERVLANRTWSNFSFNVKETEQREHVLQLIIQAKYLGGNWSTVVLEVASGGETEVESVSGYPLEALGLPATSRIPCLNHYEQIAQKLHAVSEPEERNERYRDLVDIFLLDTQLPRDDVKLASITEEVFLQRAQHPWPCNVVLRAPWRGPLTQLLHELNITKTPEEISFYVASIVGRLLGFSFRMNYEYRFLLLEGHDQTHDLAHPVKSTPAREAFERMTRTEGFRLLQLVPYPRVAGYLLAVLERPVLDAQG